MSTAYEELLASNVWDSRFDLPAVPQHLNPHIYAAYAVRVLEAVNGAGAGSEEWMGAQTIRKHYAETFLKACEPEPGRLTTYPGRGTASHDDAHGAAFLNADFAARCVDFLAENDGAYRKSGEHDDSVRDMLESEPANDYRFLFYLPSLKAHAKFRLGVLTQLQFVVDLMANLWFSIEGDCSGRLLLWLAFPAMKRGVISGAFIDTWSAKQMRKGITPRSMLTKYYLTECPWFGKWARDDWQ